MTLRSALLGTTVSAILLTCPLVPAAGQDAGQDTGIDLGLLGSGLSFDMPGTVEINALLEVNSIVMADTNFAMRLVGNRVEEENIARSTVIEDSGHDNIGIVSINQESGNMNNQANIRVLAITTAGQALQVMDATGVMELRDNYVQSSGPRETRIENSFHNTTGIVGVNQSAGNLNQEANVVALGFGLDMGPDTVVLGNAALAMVGTEADNTLIEDTTSPRQDVLTDSFTNFRGIAQVNQSSGDMNRLGNVVSVAVTVVTVP